MREEDWWQNRRLARGGKKKRAGAKRLTPEAIDDLMLCYYKEPWCEWYIARDKDAETGKSRLAGQDRDDGFYRSFGTGALEDLKWGQGKRVKKGIRIVRRSQNAVTLEGEDKPLVFRLSGEMHDGEPVYRFLAGNSQRKRARVAPRPCWRRRRRHRQRRSPRPRRRRPPPPCSGRAGRVAAVPAAAGGRGRRRVDLRGAGRGRGRPRPAAAAASAEGNHRRSRWSPLTRRPTTTTPATRRHRSSRAQPQPVRARPPAVVPMGRRR